MADEITPTQPPPPPSNHVPVNIEDEMRKSYVDYAMSVIIGRALPDVRDGLKPVHRRILVGMRDMGLASNRAYRKCAKIVGEVMGNYHPHGDGPIYDALVRMAQDQCVVNRAVTVRMIVAHDLTDDLRALAICSIRSKTHITHANKNAAMNRLQAVTNVRQSAA